MVTGHDEGEGETGKAAKWELTYLGVKGHGADHGDVAAAPAVVTIEDTYDDAGTTTRIMHTAYFGATDGTLQPGYYLFAKLRAVTPVGAALAADPVMLSLDLVYDVLPHG